MIFISHRGNLNGVDESRENSPTYIIEALNEGIDVEIDVWFIGNEFFLGHDTPQYKVDYKFLLNEKLWCHAKNIDALMEMKKYVIHYFWHEKDTVSLTSKNYVWSYPTKNFKDNTIAVLPEIYNSSIENCRGVCSDLIMKYKNKYD